MRYRHGFVLGKFMPLHAGHVYLLDTARSHCDQLTILLCSRPDDPIAGGVRLGWLQRQFPDANIIHRPNPLPRQQFLELFTGHKFDVVFSSEPYGAELAQVIGARWHVEVDRPRTRFPVSGTAIRHDPLAHWEFVPDIVRPYFD